MVLIITLVSPGLSQNIQAPTLQLLYETYSLDGLSLLSMKDELETPSIDPYSTTNQKATVQTPASALPNPMLLPKAWCYEDLAIFCKIEVRMQKRNTEAIQLAESRKNFAHCLQAVVVVLTYGLDVIDVL